MGTTKTSGVKRLSLSDSAVARAIDPRTGSPLRPLGVVGGRFVWPQMGASPDDPADGGTGTDDDDKDPEGEGSTSKDSDEGGDKDKESSKDTSGNPDAKIEDLEQEKERHFRRRKEAEDRAEKAEKELAELRGKDKPETEKLQSQVRELESSNTALAESLETAHLEVAFLKDNTYSWHNPGRALKLADLSGVEIDDDGSVHGLKDALDKLAKSDPYLINKEGKSDSDKDKDKGKDAPNTSDPKNKSKKEKTKDSEDAAKKKLLEKYPALRR